MAVRHVENGPASGTVLITGATGFTGSSLVLFYAARGWEVHGTYRREPDDSSWLPEAVKLHQLDLTDGPAVGSLVRNLRPAVIHHLAARSSVAASWRDPLGTLDANAAAQYHLLEAICRWVPKGRVVVAGSCDVYGRVATGDNPIAEDHPLLPVNPYALSKVVQDLMAFQYFAVHGLPVIRARPFLQLGPRRSDRFVAGSFARQVAEIEAGQRIPVIEVGNIHLDRDFTDVRDVARALSVLAESGLPGDAYNIASGAGHSLRNMLDIMVRAAGLTVEIRQIPSLQRPDEAPVIVGDASKLREHTGWSPQISFEQSAIDTLDYWRELIRRAHISEREMV